jgi:leucyl-tRNA synthetase
VLGLSPTLSKGEGERPGYQTANYSNYEVLKVKALDMRKNPTPEENITWDFLRKEFPNCHFRRQHIIDNFIVDFVSLKNKLVIEIDGEIHDTQKERDNERTKILANLGFTVIRFTNNQIANDLVSTKKEISLALKVLPSGEDLGGAFFTVFTTRADTLFGATYAVLAPEHDLISEFLRGDIITNKSEIEKYIEEVKNKTDIERSAEGREKTGVKLEGVAAINPANQNEIPIYIADYVLASYGTGAIMAVPAHDERDYEFAKKYNINIEQVIKYDSFYVGAVPEERSEDIMNYVAEKIMSSDGILINSGEFDGMTSEEARKKITEYVGGRLVTKYKLREWVFARQRYWGEPFPIVFATDENGKVIDSEHYVVSDSELPVKLPDVENYEPTGTGESPLAAIEEFVNVYGYINDVGEFVSCGKGEAGAKLFKRETNTMPQWAGSSWYYLRFIDNKNSEYFVSKDLESKWSPVDFYVGGAEHATRHLIYARFWHKFLFDMGLVSSDEPFKKLQTVGLIMAEDGRKMSKRWGNVVNPDDVINEYGADTLRIYEMFMGPFDGSVAWSTSSIRGVRRFLDRAWNLQSKINENADNEVVVNRLVKKVVDEVLDFKFNTAVAAMMSFLNEVEAKGIKSEDYKKFVKVLAPFAPHMCEELWQSYFNEGNSITSTSIPAVDESKLVDHVVTIAVQVAGKLRGTIEAPKDSDEDTALEMAKSTEWGQKYIVGDIKKIIFVKNKILNIVI